jgi:hypothetical protein
MKKAILLLILILVITGGVFAQQERAKNSFLLEFGIVGAELSYERMLSPHFSLLVDASYFWFIISDELTASGKIRWYPLGKAWYLEFGAGYVYGRSLFPVIGEAVGKLLLMIITFFLYIPDGIDKTLAKTHGVILQPAMGWKIDIGKKDGWVLPISMGLDIKLAKMPDVIPYLRIGVGYSF